MIDSSNIPKRALGVNKTIYRYSLNYLHATPNYSPLETTCSVNRHWLPTENILAIHLPTLFPPAFSRFIYPSILLASSQRDWSPLQAAISFTLVSHPLLLRAELLSVLLFLLSGCSQSSFGSAYYISIFAFESLLPLPQPNYPLFLYSCPSVSVDFPLTVSPTFRRTSREQLSRFCDIMAPRGRKPLAGRNPPPQNQVSHL